MVDYYQLRNDDVLVAVALQSQLRLFLLLLLSLHDVWKNYLLAIPPQP